MIVFATPMYGGQCTKEFHESAMNLAVNMTRESMEFEWITTANESLIPRARNTSVATFMSNKYLQEFTHFMFIDADIEFAPEDVIKLYNMDKDVAVAAYPMKKEGSSVTAWKDGDLIDLNEFDKPTTVDYAGTGFMMIKREVFDTMALEYPELEHEEGNVGKCFSFFDTKVMDDEDKIGGEYMDGKWYCSEDYLFCHRWRKQGGEVWLEPSIRLGHVGRHVYR